MHNKLNSLIRKITKAIKFKHKRSERHPAWRTVTVQGVEFISSAFLDLRTVTTSRPGRTRIRNRGPPNSRKGFDDLIRLVQVHHPCTGHIAETFGHFSP